MKTLPVPEDEAARLWALRALSVLDTPPEPHFDDLVKMACALLGLPVATVSLVDEARVWHKARLGREDTQEPREGSFAAHVVAQGAPLVVADASLDERFALHPQVKGPPHLRFYVGHPLRSARGHVLGVLQVQGRDPVQPTDEQLSWLAGLARQAQRHLQARSARHGLPCDHPDLLYKRFFEVSPTLLSVSNLEGYFEHLSPAWSDLTGWSREQLMTRHSQDFIHPEDKNAAMMAAAHLRKQPDSDKPSLARENKLLDFESRFLCTDGSWRWLRWRCITDPRSQRILSIAHDLTRERSYLRELQQTAHRATEANRAKTHFLTRISHELKTPLNTIIGFADLLGASNLEAFSPEQRLDHLARISSNGRKLRTLIDHILDMTRLEAREMQFYEEDFQLTALIREQVAALQAGDAQPPEVICYLPDEVGPLHADRHRVGQILHHLLDNALKFGQGHPIQVQLLTDAQHRPLRLDVVDQGIGIDHEQQKLIFQPFRQVEESISRRFGGSGLGLPLVAALCHAMGFTLRIHSSPGEGSTFSILLHSEALS